MFKLHDYDPNFWWKWIANIFIVLGVFALGMMLLGFF
jgi:hypothetical protein|tara:strand:+ start:43 stop:153 length:111 start_codon:yes stop_codon:yes gene_type:complete